MDTIEAVRIATRSIRAHKLRSTLTVIGIVIGIASVVTFATFGASVKADVISEVEGTSANNIYVLATPDDEDGPGFDDALQPVFTTHDLERLREIDGVRTVLPRGNVPTSTLAYRNDTVARTQVTATVPESITTEDVVRGRAFRAGANEVVLNEPAVRAFEENVSVGSTITLTRPSEETVELEVVGVVSGTAGQLPFGSFAGQPRFFVPTDPFYRTAVESPSLGVNQLAYPQVTVVADSTRTVETKRRVRAYLPRSDAARLVPGGVSVTAQTGGDFVDRIGDVIDRITQFVTGIAVLALVVGAIGIGNIMLVSVTERTREIGIMKAVGARNRDVVQLFLVESAALGALGAVLGVPLGVAVGYGATIYADVGFTPAYDWIVIAVVAGVCIGVVAGLYPAWRAARVNPIDALRHE